VKKLRYFLETALLEVVAWILPRLPRPVLLALARGIGTLAFHLDKRGRTTALDNLMQYDEAGRRRIAKGSYQTFARTFLDLFWSSRLTKDNWQPFFDIHIPQPEIEDQARRTGGVWVTPHFGNFELVSMIWGFRGFPFTVVAQDFKNPALTRLFTKLRQHSGHTIIPQENAMIKLIKTLKRQGHAGLLTDLNIVPGKAAAAIQCFGMWTCVPTLHVELAKRLGLSIITGVCRPLGLMMTRVSSPSAYGMISRPPSASIPSAGCGCTSTGATSRMPTSARRIPPIPTIRMRMPPSWR
jgi:KDO2-lipid IV(A) lauroyltransferase